MRKHSIAISATMNIALALALTTVVMAADPHVGTWKLNLAKSKYTSMPAPKSETAKLEAQGNGVKYAIDGVDAEGKKYHQEFAFKYDGKDYPFTGNSDIDSISSKRVDATTVEFVTKKGGKEMSKGREVISIDGKTITVTEEGKDAKGEGFKITFIMEKQ
jgi:hypothetical protein